MFSLKMGSVFLLCFPSLAPACIHVQEARSPAKRMMLIVHQNMTSRLLFLLNPIDFVFRYLLTFGDRLSQPKSSYTEPVLDTSSQKKYDNQYTKLVKVCMFTT